MIPTFMMMKTPVIQGQADQENRDRLPSIFILAEHSSEQEWLSSITESGWQANTSESIYLSWTVESKTDWKVSSDNRYSVLSWVG